MEGENDNIGKALFKDWSSMSETFKDDPELLLYLAQLSSWSVDQLAKEPARLSEEASAIADQTQELAFNNYKMFIETAECSKRIYQDFGIIEQKLSLLVEKVPSFIDQCRLFSKQSQEIMMSREMNATILAKHAQLIEILELPQLMDTCVRNGYYEEALELVAYMKSLERKHSSIFIIKNIIQDVQDSVSFMVKQLLSQLRSNIQLPACLKIISYLRRMDIFSEAELRIKFLQVRDSWFASVLKSISTDDAYYHITKTIEMTRVHLFDIITQYRAIFSDEEQAILLPNNVQGNEASLFSSWVLHKINEFLTTLESDLQRGIGNRLDSLLGHCMYFGLSFSRIGADFRMLLLPIFQKAVLDGLTKNVDAAHQRFEENMLSYTLSSSTALLGSSALSAAPAQDCLHPPTGLVAFAPLAHYCNSLLLAFNTLHLCTPMALTVQVTQCIQKSLENVALIIQQFYRAEESMATSSEKEVLIKFCIQFSFELVPYIDNCLQAIFPSSVLASVLGISVSELEKSVNVGKLDCGVIIEPLKSLIATEETLEFSSPAETGARKEIASTVEVGARKAAPATDVVKDAVEDERKLPEAVRWDPTVLADGNGANEVKVGDAVSREGKKEDVSEQ